MHEEQKDIDIDSVRKNYKEFIKKTKKLILKSQQTFRGENHNIVSEEELTRLHWVLMMIKE